MLGFARDDRFFFLRAFNYLSVPPARKVLEAPVETDGAVLGKESS